MKRFLWAFGVLGLVLGVAAQAKADYVFTTLDVDLASGINDAGQIVGANNGAGFLYSAGIYTTINVPSSSRQSTTTAYGINNAGEIVGSYYDGNENSTHGFLLSGASYIRLDPPGSAATAAFAINNTGQILGSYVVGNSQLGFLLSGGSYTPFSVPGSISTFAFGINDAGQIVGRYGSGDISHGYLLSDGIYSTIDIPGSPRTSASGINITGQIVGWYDVGPIAHGFLLSEGRYTTIDVPGSFFTFALGINDGGQIVGQYYDSGGNAHGFLATPVPEPSTLCLIGIGTVALIAWAWRRSGLFTVSPGTLNARPTE